MNKVHLLPPLFVLLVSCQSFQTDGATRKEKSSALEAHLAAWEPAIPINRFTPPRTIQLFTGLTLDPEADRISAASTGLATLLSTDGYALTANHVLNDGPASILQLEFPRPGHLTLTGGGAVFTPRDTPDEPTRVFTRHLKTGSVRLVHRFPGSDLVLVHLPVSPSVTFQLAPGPPARDSTVFGYGSTLSGSASAGRILRVARRNQTWKLTTSVPLRKGDSGGPVMDRSGRLVAIISRSQTRPFSSELSATIANGVSPAIIHSLIAQDRGR